MKTISTDQLLAQVSWRHATKQFDAQSTVNPSIWAAPAGYRVPSDREQVLVEV